MRGRGRRRSVDPAVCSSGTTTRVAVTLTADVGSMSNVEWSGLVETNLRRDCPRSEGGSQHDRAA